MRPRKQTLYDWCIKNGRQDILNQWHPTKNGKLKPTDVTVATTQKVWWQIEVDGKVYEWKASISHRNSGQTHPTLSQSHLEKAVADICDKLKINKNIAE